MVSARRSLVLIAVAVFGLGVDGTWAWAETRPPAPESGWQQINLLGMVVRQGGSSFAIIQDPVTGKTEFVSLGGDVKGARLTRILSDRIVLTQGNVQLVFRLGVSGGRPLRDAEGTTISSSGEHSQPAGSRGRPLSLASAVSERDASGPPPSHIVSPGGRPKEEPRSGSGSDARGSQEGGSSPLNSDSLSGSPSAQLRISGLHHNGVLQELTQFVTANLRDLHFDVDYSQVSGSHRQRIELFSPDGTLYQRRFRDVEITAGQPVNTRVPVGGTWITEHALFGNWRVAVYLDASQTPIASGAFILSP